MMALNYLLIDLIFVKHVERGTGYVILAEFPTKVFIYIYMFFLELNFISIFLKTKLFDYDSYSIFLRYCSRLELRDEWRLENRRAFANIWSDMVFGISLFVLLICNQSKVSYHYSTVVLHWF